MSSSLVAMHVAAGELIRSLLETVLDAAPGASVVCLNTTELGLASGVQPRPRLGVTAPGRSALRWNDATWRKRPPADWRALLPSLGAGYCSLLGAEGETKSPQVLVCPAIDPAGTLSGAICIVWEGSAKPPTPRRRVKLIRTAAHAGSRIARILDLCAIADGCQPRRIAA